MSAGPSEHLNAISSRKPRSRLDRPCDACRRLKHMCTIPVRGEPCQSCKLRRKTCAFDMPPTARKRKSAVSPVGSAALLTSPPPRVVRQDVDQSTATIPSAGSCADASITSNAIDNILEQAADISDLATVLANSGTTPINPAVMTFGLPSDPALSETSLSDDDADIPLPNLPSLDLDPDMEQESHYLGSLAVFSFTVPDTSAISVNSTSPSQLSLRQVSSDPRSPVFFLKSPSLLYGRTQTNGKASFDAVCRLCGGGDSNVPSKALASLKQFTLPAVPFINIKRLETTCLEIEGSGPVPYALLAGVIAHSTVYIPEIKGIHKELWSQALMGLDDDYRLPRLSTLQLALVQLYSRPMEIGENSGQVEIALARAVGAAQLLGLHMDPSKWSLPLWERTLRKRIWWALLIQDKWRALLYGRPSKINTSDHSVPLPVIEDGDWGRHVSATDQISLETFIATCKLTSIVDKVLDEFYTVKAMLASSSPISKLGILEQCLSELNACENTIPQSRQYRPLLSSYPTGVRSFQLSCVGLRVIIQRLMLHTSPPDLPLQRARILHQSMSACQDVVGFMTSLSPSERTSYWAPYSSHHLSNTLSLLLVTAVQIRSDHPAYSSDPMITVHSFVERLISLYGSEKWDVAGLALRRAITLLTRMQENIPELAELAGVVARTVGLGQNAAHDPTAQLLASIGVPQVDSDMTTWFGTDFSWLTDFQSFLNQDGLSSIDQSDRF